MYTIQHNGILCETNNYWSAVVTFGEVMEEYQVMNSEMITELLSLINTLNSSKKQIFFALNCQLIKKIVSFHHLFTDNAAKKYAFI